MSLTKLISSTTILMLLLISTPALAVPPATPYNPAETLDPICGPTDPNCFVTIPEFTGTSGSIPFIQPGGTDQPLTEDNSNLFWDSTNNRLGVNTAGVPTDTLDVNGLANITNLFPDDGRASFALEEDIFSLGFGIQGASLSYTNPTDYGGAIAYNTAQDIPGIGLTAGMGIFNGTVSPNSNLAINDGDVSLGMTFLSGDSADIGIEAGSTDQIRMYYEFDGNDGQNDFGMDADEIDFNYDFDNKTGENGRVYLNKDEFGYGSVEGADFTVSDAGRLILETPASNFQINEVGVINHTAGGGAGEINLVLSAGFFQVNGGGSWGSILDSTGLAIHNLTSGGNTNLVANASGRIILDPSDAKLKTDLEPLENALDKVNQLNPISYGWKDTDRFGTKREIGFLAQEVQEIIPEVVSQGNEYLSVSYGDLTALNAKAIQELDLKFDEIEALADFDDGDERGLTALIERVVGDIKEWVVETLTAKKVVTDEVCLEDICINKSDLENILQNNNIKTEDIDQDLEESPEETQELTTEIEQDPPINQPQDPETTPETQETTEEVEPTNETEEEPQETTIEEEEQDTTPEGETTPESE